MPDIPDFTRISWQQEQSNAALLASILDGKGQDMPAFHGKLKQNQASQLVAQVRAFAPTADQGTAEKPRKAGASTEFEKSFGQLQGELDELKEQLQKVPTAPAEKKSSESSTALRSSDPSTPGTSKSQGTPVASAAARPAVASERELFRQHCVKCHGEQGTGSRARPLQPTIPDFSDASWQARRSDARLKTSILEGKGKDMPPWRGKISEEQASALVGYIRALAQSTRSREAVPRASVVYGPGDREEEAEASFSAEPTESQPPVCFMEKLIRWLGNFHPATVHFPIALLTAAALAELLQLATDWTTFSAVSRYCVWFGTLTALGAAALGWFLGGFRWTDDSWILMTHRWLGTSTVALAGLVLLLLEVSRRSDRRALRLCFRLTLLVGAALVLLTGFFGGAVVFGLDHYVWPQ
jgi:mono/diheme cytochrome c family protein/uncharacterized membrane protein